MEDELQLVNETINKVLDDQIQQKVIDQNVEIETCFILKKISEIVYADFIFNICPILFQTFTIYFINIEYSNNLQQINITDAVGLAFNYYGCFVHSVISGLLMTIEQICSNAYGASKFKLLGIYMQRAHLICHFLGIILIILNYFVVQHTIGLFTSDKAIIDNFKSFYKLMIFAVIFHVQSMINTSYMNVINKSFVSMIIGLISLGLHPFWCYFFMNVLKMGFHGLGFAIIFTYMLITLQGLFYIYIKRPLPESIFMYNKQSFEKLWDLFIKMMHNQKQVLD